VHDVIARTAIEQDRRGTNCCLVRYVVSRAASLQNVRERSIASQSARNGRRHVVLARPVNAMAPWHIHLRRRYLQTDGQRSDVLLQARVFSIPTTSGAAPYIKSNFRAVSPRQQKRKVIADVAVVSRSRWLLSCMFLFHFIYFLFHQSMIAVA